jgi:uracil-DNA glycosylase
MLCAKSLDPDKKSYPAERFHFIRNCSNDASGNRLRQWLGVSREQFYDPRNFAILPMGFCFPGYDQKGADLPPRPECAPAWRREALALMPQIDLFLAIGLYAQKWHLPQSVGNLTANVERWTRQTPDKSKLQVVSLPHPSWRNTGWLKKHPWFEIETLARVQTLVKERLL